MIESKRPDKTWPPNGQVIFKDYSVKYREELDHVLKSINAKIAPGEKVVLNLHSLSIYYYFSRLELLAELALERVA